MESSAFRNADMSNLKSRRRGDHMSFNDIKQAVLSSLA